MAKKCGRPAKSADYADNKQRIIDTTIDLIRKKGADYITVRNVCAAANLSIGTFYHYFRDKDELLMYFVRDTSFETCSLQTPINKIGDRVSELYMRLINRYMEFGLEFMKSFYTAGNHSLSAYMSEVEGQFEPDTVMARSEKEISAAQEQGIVKTNADAHEICMDICTIVKGCVLEWCLMEGNMDIEKSIHRIIGTYLRDFLINKRG
jgi:AcrR family transcriptional regulator